MWKKLSMFLLFLLLIGGCQHVAQRSLNANLPLNAAAELCQTGKVPDNPIIDDTAAANFYNDENTDCRIQRSDDASLSQPKTKASETGNLKPEEFDSVKSEDGASVKPKMANGSEKIKNSDGQKGKGAESIMKISVSSAQGEIIFMLNDSPAAEALYQQLPFTAEVENFSTDEKIFYPPVKLETENTPAAKAELGSLCYYAPWGDVVIFYAQSRAGDGLYVLGHAISGIELLEELHGEIEIKVSE